MKVKELLESAVIEKFHNFLHHIAEEELIACKVYHVESFGKRGVKFIADCQDIPRKEGYQPDLSKKINDRLKKHKLQKLNRLIAKVYHQNIDNFFVGKKNDNV